jgi:hypothetical protein
MKKLSKGQMKKIIGGNAPNNQCSADCPAGYPTSTVSCPANTLICSASNQCVTCDGHSICCTRGPE